MEAWRMSHDMRVRHVTDRQRQQADGSDRDAVLVDPALAVARGVDRDVPDPSLELAELVQWPAPAAPDLDQMMSNAEQL